MRVPIEIYNMITLFSVVDETRRAILSDIRRIGMIKDFEKKYTKHNCSFTGKTYRTQHPKYTYSLSERCSDKYCVCEYCRKRNNHRFMCFSAYVQWGMIYYRETEPEKLKENKEKLDKLINDIGKDTHKNFPEFFKRSNPNTRMTDLEIKYPGITNDWFSSRIWLVVVSNLPEDRLKEFCNYY